MTEQEIIQRLKDIKASAGDDEGAHGMEDKLAWDFIRYIAKGSTEDAAKAKLVLKSTKIQFSRWYA